MPDDVTRDIEKALEVEHKDRPPDIEWVVARGRRIRLLRFVTMVLSVVAVTGLLSTALIAFPRDGSPDPVTGDESPPSQASPSPQKRREGEVVEQITEQEQAEIFAFRAVAATGLMNPFGERSYHFTSRDDTTRTAEGWRIGFAASDCEPRMTRQGLVFTCRGLSGEDPELGNSSTDTFVTVSLDDRKWRVVKVDGNMLDDERERLIGFTLPQRKEPSHWEFPAVGVWSEDEETFVEMIPVWVGPYPTVAPGSVCEVEEFNAEGEMVGDQSLFYEETPNREFERAGWVRGTGADRNAVQLTVDCRQYTGRGWEVASGPEIVGNQRRALSVEAELVWRGDEGFTSPAVCRATLVNEAGEVVGEESGRVEPLRHPSELKNYPYRADMSIWIGDEPADAEAIGEFTCRSP